MRADKTNLTTTMERAVEVCSKHVGAGGLPFVGVVLSADGEVVSGFGVNQVAETGDPTAHAEIVAMREAMIRHDVDSLAGYSLLATGEPCGLCYRYAIDHGIEVIFTAVDRDEVADHGFDYRSSYHAFGITEQTRSRLIRLLRVECCDDPFNQYIKLHLSGRFTPRPNIESKGTPL